MGLYSIFFLSLSLTLSTTCVNETDDARGASLFRFFALADRSQICSKHSKNVFAKSARVASSPGPNKCEYIMVSAVLCAIPMGLVLVGSIGGQQPAWLQNPDRLRCVTHSVSHSLRESDWIWIGLSGVWSRRHLSSDEKTAFRNRNWRFAPKSHPLAYEEVD